MKNGFTMMSPVVVGLTYVDILYLEEAATSYQIENLFADGFQGVNVQGINDINDARQIATSGPGGPVLLTPSVATSVGELTVGPIPANDHDPLRRSREHRRDLAADLDVAGRHVQTLAEGRMPAGRHTVVWRGRDESGRSVPFYRLEADGRVETRKMTLLK